MRSRPGTVVTTPKIALDDELIAAVIEYLRLRELQHAIRTTKQGPSPTKLVAGRLRNVAALAETLARRVVSAGASEEERCKLFTMTLTISEKGKRKELSPSPGGEDVANLIRAIEEIFSPSGNVFASAALVELFWENFAEAFGEAKAFNIGSVEDLLKLASMCKRLAERLEEFFSEVAEANLKSRAENAAMDYLVRWQEKSSISTRRLARVLVALRIEPGSEEQVRQRLEKIKRYRRQRQTSPKSAASNK